MTNETNNLSVAISIDIAPERISSAYVTQVGLVEAMHSVPLPINDGADAVLETIAMLCKVVQEQAPAPIQGVGISTMGIVHHLTGEILHSDEGFEVLEHMPLVERIADLVDAPTRVENRVNAMALAEATYGAGMDSDNFFYIFADEVLNGAIVQSGELWHGSHFSAGQIAHLVAGWMSQKPVTLTQKASGLGIAAEYNMRSRKFRVPAIRDILQYAKHGDQLAIRVVRDGAYLLASVLSPIISLLDPQRVVVSGVLLKNGDLWWNTFTDTLRESPLPALQQVEVVQADITTDAALIGAAVLVFRDTLVKSER